MTQRDESESLPWKIWPRTPEGWCSCPYCTANREGRLPHVVPPRKRDWLERMGGRGQSVSAQMIEEGFRDVA